MPKFTNTMVAAAITKCNHHQSQSAAAFERLLGVGFNASRLHELDQKYQLAASVNPRDPLSVMPDPDRTEYLLLVAQQGSAAAFRGLLGIVQAMLKERESP